MNNVEKMLKRIKDAQRAEMPKRVSGSLIEYDVEAEKEDLSYIDKFLRIIADEHKVSITYEKADTAHIDMTNHSIVLPTYILQDKDLYLLMGSHEVSHALHTPREFYESHNTSGAYPEIAGIKLTSAFFMCINIVEDIRIERLIREKFPGFKAVYRRAYKKLMESQPGFKISSQAEWDSLQIHNKLNMYAKGGDVIPYSLTDSEMAIYNDIANTVSFNDVLVKSITLHNLIKKEMAENTSPKKDKIINSGESDDIIIDDDETSSNSDSSDESDNDDETSSNSDSSDESVKNGENNSSIDDPLDSNLLQELSESLDDLDEEEQNEIQPNLVDDMEKAQRADMQRSMRLQREVVEVSSYDNMLDIVKNPLLGMVTPE